MDGGQETMDGRHGHRRRRRPAGKIFLSVALVLFLARCFEPVTEVTEESQRARRIDITGAGRARKSSPKVTKESKGSSSLG